MIDSVDLTSMTSVMARIDAMAVPPTRVAQLQTKFEAMLGDAAGPTDAATAETVEPGATSVPVATPSAASSWMQAEVLGAPRIIAAPTRLSAAYQLSGSPSPVVPTTPRGTWVDRVPNARGKALAPAIQGVADRYGLDPALLAAVFWTESSYQPDVVSSAGAVGLGQLMPGTAATLGVDPYDPMQNMDGSARLYRRLIDKYDGDLELAISAYACGEGAVARAGGVPSDFARGYIDKLLGRRDYLNGSRATPP
jgi:soluble lytic murein transglycosylase-like protein